jgi:hypothetical protein
MVYSKTENALGLGSGLSLASTDWRRIGLTEW